MRCTTLSSTCSPIHQPMPSVPASRIGKLTSKKRSESESRLNKFFMDFMFRVLSGACPRGWPWLRAGLEGPSAMGGGDFSSRRRPAHPTKVAIFSDHGRGEIAQLGRDVKRQGLATMHTI